MRGLICYEKRNMCFLMLIFTGAVGVLLKNMILLDIVSEKKEFANFSMEFYQNYGTLFLQLLNQYTEMLVFLLPIPIAFMVILQYRETTTAKAAEFLMLLPLKRSVVFGIRTLIGMLVYTVPWLLFSAGVLFLRIHYASWYESRLASIQYGAQVLGCDSLQHLCIYLIYIWIVLTMIYSICVLWQNLCTKPWFAGAAAVGTIFFPYFINYEIMTLRNLGSDSFQWWVSLFLGKGPVSQISVYDERLDDTVLFQVFDRVEIIMIFQCLVIVLCLGLAFWIFTKRDLADRQRFLLESWMEDVLVLGSSFCVVLYLAIQGFQLQKEIGAFGVLAVTVGSVAVIYYIFRKSRGRRGKADVL